MRRSAVYTASTAALSMFSFVCVSGSSREPVFQGHHVPLSFLLHLTWILWLIVCLAPTWPGTLPGQATKLISGSQHPNGSRSFSFVFTITHNHVHWPCLSYTVCLMSLVHATFSSEKWCHMLLLNSGIQK